MERLSHEQGAECEKQANGQRQEVPILLGGRHEPGRGHPVRLSCPFYRCVEATWPYNKPDKIIRAADPVMLDHPLEFQGCSVVVLGSFNPTIFQPLWFSANNLISSEEANSPSTKIEIIHKNATIFSTEWFLLQVTADRFSIETSDPAKSQPLRDLAVGTFRVLEHTPLTVFGLNWYGHFRMASHESWHAFGHHFAPKESWHAIMKEPGLRQLIIEGKRENCTATISVAIEPSLKIDPGVFIRVNEQHDLGEPKEASSADRNRRFLETLQGSWSDFLGYGATVSRHLLSAYSTTVPRGKKRRR
jgi:hypothetical protein